MRWHHLFELLRLAAGQLSGAPASGLRRRMEEDLDLREGFGAIEDLRTDFDTNWFAFTRVGANEPHASIHRRSASWACAFWRRVEQRSTWRDGWQIRTAYLGAAGREEPIEPTETEGSPHEEIGSVRRDVSAVEICRHDSVIGRLILDPVADRLSILILSHLLPPEECRVCVVRGEHREERAHFEEVEGTPYAIAELENVTPESSIRIEIGRFDAGRFLG